MRIRRKIEPWNSTLFIRFTLVLFVSFNMLIFLINGLIYKSIFESYNWVMGVMQPVLLASIFTYHSRKISLFINDHQMIDSFIEKLNKNVLSQGTCVNEVTQNTTRYGSTGWFYRLFNYWGGVETVTVQWGDEVLIEGSQRLVGQIEDSLTWNPQFKS